MNTINITPIIEAVITLAVAVITAFVIPWVKSKITQTQIGNMERWTDIAVHAYEVLVKGDKAGNERLKKVTEYLKEKCEKYNYTFNETEIRLYIENAWKAMTDKSKENETTS